MRAVVVDRWMTPDQLGVQEHVSPPMTQDGQRGRALEALAGRKTMGKIVLVP